MSALARVPWVGPGTLRARWPLGPVVGAAAVGAVLAAIWTAAGAPTQARLTLTIFVSAIVAWVATDLDDTLVALVAAMGAVAVGGVPGEALFASLGSSTVWLLVASSITALAVTDSGLARRLTVALVGRARTTAQLFRLVALATGLTTFLVPATSGRAALALPVFAALATGLGDAAVTRALALLFPSVVLLSAAASLLGAGAHLVTVDLVVAAGGSAIDFPRWLVLGGPFALTSCVLATEVILRMFLSSDQRRRPPTAAVAALGSQPQWTAPEARVGIVVVGMGLLWAVTPWHGIDPALVALGGALLVVTWGTAGVDLAGAVAEVPWHLLLFLAATVALGGALTSSGAAAWLADLALGGLAERTPAVLVVAAVAAVGLLSHLLIGSRSARATVLTPLMLVVGSATGVDPTALAFVAAIAAGYCLTLPVSAKPVAMFASASPDGYTPADLLRLSTVLLPIHFVLLLVFGLVFWPALGLPL